MLILAGVSIATLTGENGLLKKATDSKEKTIEAKIKEDIELAIMGIQTEELSKGNQVTLESLAGENGQEGQLEKTKDLEGIKADLDELGIIGEYKGYKYTINKDFKVEIVGTSETSETSEISILDEVLLEKGKKYTLEGQQKILSNAIIDTPETFTLSIEVKDLTAFFDGNVSNGVTAPIVGVGSTGSGIGYHACGIFYGDGRILFFNGVSDSDIIYNETEIDVKQWNKFKMTWDGDTLNYYVNDELIGSKSSLSWQNTKLMIGGWENSPVYTNGVYWGFINGTYRNLVFIQ